MESTRPADAPLLGERFGPYSITGFLGRGGQGEVYRGVNERLRVPVAIKVLRGTHLASETARKRFHLEKDLQCRVSHPYVTRLLDVVGRGEHTLLVMEFIEGEPLHHLLRQPGLTPEHVARYGSEIAEALTAIHAKGIVHRDLKPANVMVTDADHVKVMDFGVARLLERASEAGEPGSEETTATPLTREGAILGTVEYMSPEQLRGAAADPRSDQFSLGVVLYEALTRTHPFERATRTETASAILHEAPGGGRVPADLARVRPLREVIYRLLQKDPEKRFADTASATSALRKAYGDLSSQTGRGLRVWAGRRPVVAASVLLALATVLSFAGLALHRMITNAGAGLDLVPRPVMAVLPFEVVSSDEFASVQGQVVSSLLSSMMSESRGLRPLGSERTRDILDALTPGASLDDRLDAVRRAASVEWILTGELFREDSSWAASVEVYRAGVGPPLGSFTASAPRTTGLVRRLAQGLDELLGEGGATEVPPLAAGSEDEEANVQVFLARRSLREFRLSDAVMHLERALERDPGLLVAATLMAEAYSQAGYGRKALEASETVARLVKMRGEEIPEAERLRAEASGAQVRGDADAEIEARTALAEKFPDDPDLLRGLADALMRSSRVEDALVRVEEALSLDENDPRAHLLHAELLDRSADAASADAALARAEALFDEMGSETGKAQVLATRGNLRSRRGEYTEAEAVYLEAVGAFESARLDVLAAIARSNAADMALRRGRLDDAVAAYEQTSRVARAAGYVRLAAQDLNSMGGARFAAGDFQAAERYLREAVAATRPLENPLLTLAPVITLASLLEFTNRPGQATGLAEEGIDLARRAEDRTSGMLARNILASASLKLGRVREAAEAYGEIARLEDGPGGNPTSRAWALAGLSEAEQTSGRLSAAWDASSRAFGISSENEDRSLRGYVALRHALVAGELGRREQFTDALFRASGEASSEDGNLEDLALRVQLAEALWDARWENDPQGDRLGEVFRAARESGALDAACRSRIAQSWVRVRENRADLALRALDETLALPNLSEPDRIEARAHLAWALAAADRGDDAVHEGRRALGEAEGADLLLPAARAAAAVRRSGSLAEDDETVRRGAEALRQFLRELPERDEATVRRRADVAELIETLEVATARGAS